ncbi:MAG: transcriptional regulator [Bacteroidetes bacterium GWA2_31_9]|nr:MAG: transcriptional regulator [Bacteroidetes bacterium GWA2_31_9]
MAQLSDRILSLRKEKNWSQSDLAKMVGVTYAQIGRYETKNTQPSAEVLKKIADALNTSTDYLMYGNKDEKARAALEDTELLQQFKEVEKMNNEDKKTIKNIIDAFIKRSKLLQIAAL